MARLGEGKVSGVWNLSAPSHRRQLRLELEREAWREMRQLAWRLMELMEGGFGVNRGRWSDLRVAFTPPGRGELERGPGLPELE